MKASLVLVAISACLAPTAAAVPPRASAPSLVKRSTLVAAKDAAAPVAPRRSAKPGALAATVGIGLAVRALPAPAGTARRNETAAVSTMVAKNCSTIDPDRKLENGQCRLSSSETASKSVLGEKGRSAAVPRGTSLFGG